MRHLVGDENLHRCLANILLLEKEMLKCDPNNQLAQEIYTQLQKKPVHTSEASSFTQYVLERILDHKNPKTDFYDLSYMPLDRTLVKVPSQICLLPDRLCPNGENRIEEFLKLSRYVGVYKDFDGTKFAAHVADATRHLEYIKRLDKEKYVVLLLGGSSNLDWDKYKSDSQRPQSSASGQGNGRNHDVTGTIDEFVSYENEFRVSLQEFMRYLTNKESVRPNRYSREERHLTGLCSDRKA